jgi:hypothetical protein
MTFTAILPVLSGYGRPLYPSFLVGDLRTPLGLIEEFDGTFNCFYTGYGTQGYAGYGCLGVLSLTLTQKPRK